MYKFNFLQKINLEKQESSHRNRFITSVFLISVSAQIVLLGLLFLKSTSVNSSYDEAINEKNKFEKLSSDFRKKDFFNYKEATYVYNVQLSRTQLTYLFKSFETSLDSTMIVKNFRYGQSTANIDIISRTSGSKSKLMSEINNLKSKISDILLVDNYILKASDVELTRGPDLKGKLENSEGTQYWLFSFNIKLKKHKIGS